ncbi:MAG: DinB family protein [Chlorobium sp.]|nr:DinB family protein [Chlorobium sp.]MCW8815675.1 DinB family protein [Chlorobium sp.]MCW8818971.1 DinB family protein [Ignavibacteriaceae bacterium]
MHHLFRDSINEHLLTIAERLLKCLETIDAEKLWTDFAPNLSSPGNIVLHVIGNLNQYVLKTLGGNTVNRQRAKEFCDKPGTSRETLSEMLYTTIKECSAVIQALKNEQLTRTYTVQGIQYTGYGILIHATEHLSHHTGQFTWFCKYLFNAEIDFYKGRDLNVQ